VAAGQKNGPKGKLELKWRPFEVGLAEAQKDRKKLMLDVYTDWCGWCKKLDRDVYGDDQVSRYLNREVRRCQIEREDASNITIKTRHTPD